MAADLEVALIGLDTSHSVEFARRMQAPDCAPEQRVRGMRAVSCLRFETPFQDKAGLDQRQKQLEAWGVRVGESFDDAVAGVDAIMIEINDPALHVEYFERCASLARPVFLDKPLADTVAAGRRILETARGTRVRFFSASSLRFVSELEQACSRVPRPERASMYGPLGKAPAGSSVVWYGVHAFEMLERAMGPGAASLRALGDDAGAVVVVDYGGGRRGVVELTRGAYAYGGSLRRDREGVAFAVDMTHAYTGLLRRIEAFFRSGEPPVRQEDTLEISAMLEAVDRSLAAGGAEQVLGEEP
jgi:predicted dehydrogenase